MQNDLNLWRWLDSQIARYLDLKMYRSIHRISAVIKQREDAALRSGCSSSSSNSSMDLVNSGSESGLKQTANLNDNGFYEEIGIFNQQEFDHEVDDETNHLIDKNIPPLSIFCEMISCDVEMNNCHKIEREAGLDRKIFQHSTITSAQLRTRITSFICEHALTDTASSELIQFIDLLLPELLLFVHRI